MELRNRIDGARVAIGLPAVAWTDPPLIAGVTVVRAQHLLELRAAIVAYEVARTSSLQQP